MVSHISKALKTYVINSFHIPTPRRHVWSHPPGLSVAFAAVPHLASLPRGFCGSPLQDRKNNSSKAERMTYSFLHLQDLAQRCSINVNMNGNRTTRASQVFSTLETTGDRLDDNQGSDINQRGNSEREKDTEINIHCF